MKIKRILSIGLVVAMLAFVVGALPSAAAGDTAGDSAGGQSTQASGGQNPSNYSQAARIKNKDEVVYASLSAEGKVSGIYTVNHFEVAEKGTVVDHGNYESVVNLTDTNTIDKNGETVSFSADEGNYYYQGNMA